MSPAKPSALDRTEIFAGPGLVAESVYVKLDKEYRKPLFGPTVN
jgi:hypothetical protein